MIGRISHLIQAHCMADCTAETAFNAGWTGGGSMSASNMPTTGYCSIATALYRFAMVFLFEFDHPTTNLFVFFKNFAGIGRSSCQVIFIGLLPVCFT